MFISKELMIYQAELSESTAEQIAEERQKVEINLTDALKKIDILESELTELEEIYNEFKERLRVISYVEGIEQHVEFLAEYDDPYNLLAD